MPNDNLQSIVERMNSFFNVSTKEDLIISILQSSSKSRSGAGRPNATSLGQVASNLISVSEGGIATPELIKKFREFISGEDGPENASEELASFVNIFTSVGSQSGLGEITPIDLENILGNKNAKKLSLIIMKDINLLPAGRDSNAAILFLNTIPTLEFSRAVPFIDIQVKTGRPPLSDSGQVQGLSLSRFLGGSFTPQENTADSLLARGKLDTLEGKTSTTTSMEIFTSPQTLINADLNLDADSLRAAPVIDKFRPFLSLNSFKADITPQPGPNAFFQAELEITLHDRSRLADIADFVRPDLYANTEMLIEWGWSHPDNSDDNVFGQLLNKARSKYKFRIVNSSFKFTKAGQVKITLKLATKGAADIERIRITDGDLIFPAADAIRDIQQKVAELRRKILQRPAGIKELRGTQAMFSAAEDLSSTLILTEEQRKELKEFMGPIGRINSTTEVGKLRTLLLELFGRRQDGSGGAVETFTKNLASVIESRIKNVILDKELLDPMLDLTSLSRRLDDELKKEIESNKEKRFVSFAKLFGLFVGVPLARDGSYSDVQILFYPFNQNAGAVGNTNIGSFAVDINEFKTFLNAIARARRGISISLREFMHAVINNFLDDNGSVNYGLRGLYTTQIDPATGTRKLISKAYDGDVTTLKRHQEHRLQAAGIRDGIFKMPKVDFLIETVPGAVVAVNETQAVKNEQTILKIHVFDTSATRYEALGDRLRLEGEEDIRSMGSKITGLAEDKTGSKKIYNEFLEKLKSEGLLKRVNEVEEGEPAVYEVAGGVRRLKEFITSAIPTIVYGTNNTAIIDGGFDTIQDKKLSSVHMLRSRDAGPVGPTGLSPGNLPIQTAPARVNLKTFGCPFINYMQQFFIDFGTNTTIDNIYGVVKFQHTLESGKYISTFDLVPLDAWAEYKSLSQHVGVVVKELERINKENEDRENQ